MALANAALTVVVRNDVLMTDTCGSPPNPRTYFTAIWPGRIRAPDTIAPKVSRIRRLHASIAASGKGVLPAEIIYRASLSVIPGSAAHASRNGDAASAAAAPAAWSIHRRAAQLVVT